MATVIPGELEAAGGLQVALIQLAIAGGAFAGGVLFDTAGWWSAFLLAAVLLAGSAVLAALAGPAPEPSKPRNRRSSCPKESKTKSSSSPGPAAGLARQRHAISPSEAPPWSSVRAERDRIDALAKELTAAGLQGQGGPDRRHRPAPGQEPRGYGGQGIRPHRRDAEQRGPDAACPARTAQDRRVGPHDRRQHQGRALRHRRSASAHEGAEVRTHHQRVVRLRPCGRSGCDRLLRHQVRRPRLVRGSAARK